MLELTCPTIAQFLELWWGILSIEWSSGLPLQCVTGDWGEAKMKDLYVGLRERNVLTKNLTTIYLLRVTCKVLVYSELCVTRNMFHPFGDYMGLDGQKRQEVANVAKGL